VILVNLMDGRAASAPLMLWRKVRRSIGPK